MVYCIGNDLKFDWRILTSQTKNTVNNSEKKKSSQLILYYQIFLVTNICHDAVDKA